MITLDALRSVLLSDQPYTRLDELVRAELAAGRLTKQIHDELYGLEDAVRAMPGFCEDAEEALRDTIDALNGFCPAKYAYRNPPVLPAEEEIAKLPHWTKIAFAARCARRVLVLFRAKWPDAPDDYAKTLAQAVALGETSAAQAGAGEEWDSRAGAITSALYVCDAVINASRDRNRAVQMIDALSAAVSKFKDKPDDILDSHSGGAFFALTNNTQVAIATGVATSPETYDAANAIAGLAIRRDFDHVAKLAEWQRWTDDTPVPPEVFGPVWPEGPPPGWPADPHVPQRTELPLELMSRARLLEQMTADEAVNLFNAINEYHIARTGHRLTMEDLRPLIAAAVPAEV